MFTLIKKMFLTVIIAMVTVSANAQTDTTRAQGYYDFYVAVLAADTATVPVTYYGSVDTRQRETSGIEGLSFYPTEYSVLQSATFDTTAAAGHTRFIELTDDVLDLLDQHTDGKVTDTEKTTTRETLEALRFLESVSDRLYGLTETDIRTVRLPATLAAGAVAPTVTPPDNPNPPVVTNPNPPDTQNPPDTMNPPDMTAQPTGGGGGGGGAGAAVAVAAVGGALYWWKIRNPATTFTFAAMPIDTDAYTAQLNFAPRENWHINVEYTESNLFASHDFVKPETNSTAKVTVKYTW